MSTLILFVLLLLLLDALVSAAEAAIFSVPLHRAKFLADKYRLGKILLPLKESMERPITTLIALSNFITILGSVMTGIIADRVFGEEWVGAFAAVLTFLVMVFGEIAPKRLGERYAEHIALAAAPAVLALSGIFTPITWLIQKITRPFLGSVPKTTSEEEIAFLAGVAEREGAIEHEENRLIQTIFRFNDITAADIMTPKPLVDFIDGNRTVAELAEVVKTAKHSRLPVYESDVNNIVGMVHQRNLLIALANGEVDQPVKNFAWDAMIVPESRPIDDLLKDMREKRAQLAVVISDYGNVVGVVGIEDIIEELVGEIIDEKDVAPELIKRVSKNEIVVHGQTRIAYINQFFNTEIKSKKSVNGLLLEKFGEIPALGASFEAGGVRFHVEVVGPRTIDRVRIIKNIEKVV
ncbi:MAG: HlyC/CorC family transporter [Candidatus Liptonbacteria bacterium]|nr:HlyC/CorC family transporter [Candidatus Liptonbacteria bacterium]